MDWPLFKRNPVLSPLKLYRDLNLDPLLRSAAGAAAAALNVLLYRQTVTFHI